MLCKTVIFVFAAACIALASPVLKRRACSAEQRLAGAKLIPHSYNAVTPGESAAGFGKLPLTDDCHTYINPNGGPPILVAIDEATTKDFALATRQVFSKVTGQYTDYPENTTTVIHTNVTLGALHSVAVPVTFYADVYLIYEASSCLIERIQAFATIPTIVGGNPINPPILPMILNASPLDPKPTA